jgi:hypothetical protein
VRVTFGQDKIGLDAVTVWGAGVGFEDRKVLLGHKSDHVTTHYSAPEIGALIEASEKVCDLGSRKSPALSIVRAQQRIVST